MTTPPEVVAMLAGRPAAGRWEPMFPLLTVDDAGFPHVCLLSRAELGADSRRVYAVLASRNTIANLGRDGRATLVAVGADTAVYVKLTVSESIADGDWLGVAYEVASAKRDSLHIPLRPPQYLVTKEVSVTEDWARGERMLARLARLLGQQSRSSGGLPLLANDSGGQRGHGLVGCVETSKCRRLPCHLAWLDPNTTDLSRVGSHEDVTWGFAGL